MPELRLLKEASEPQPILAFGESLLLTRMQPPSLTSVFSRPRLLESLDTPAPFTLVIAPAGSGKTTLLVDWARRREGVSWLTADESDNDVQQFAHYLCGCFDLHPMASPPQEMLVRLLNHVAAGKQAGTLILDSVHTLTSRKAHQLIVHLLDHQPRNLRLIIASRTLPPLPLARLRVQGRLNVIRTADLSFTAEEASAFFAAQHPNVTIERALRDRVIGWAAGLQLLALAHQEGEFQADRAELTRQYVREYLVQEVLLAQPASVQSFLLQTAFLERLTPDQCNVITRRNDSQAMLQNLHANELFLRRHSDQSYTYLPFFRDALREHLTITNPDETQAVLNRISLSNRGLNVFAAEDATLSTLSEREREVLALLADGHSSPEIARQMIIAVSTVKTHIKHIYRKLNVDNRHQALKRAQQLNLVQIEIEGRFRQMIR
jgi:LuxR family maltose regulon positive regulatory protein